MFHSDIEIGPQHPIASRRKDNPNLASNPTSPALVIARSIETQVLNELHRVPNIITSQNKTIKFLASIINKVMLILEKDVNIGVRPTLIITDNNSIVAQLKEMLKPIVESLESSYSIDRSTSAPIHLYLQSDPLLTIDYPVYKISSEIDIHLIRSTLQSVVDILTTKYIAGQHILEMQELAMNDPLLGIPGRRALDQAIYNYKRLNNVKNKFPVSVLMIDLDRFKSVNDKYGHNIGDQVLVHVSDLIRLKCKSYTNTNNNNSQASLYRMGGEELACIISNCTPEQAYDFAIEINAELRKTPFFMNETVKIHQTASIGIATANSSVDFKDVILSDGSRGGTKVLKCADSALFKAKVLRDTTAVFEPELLENLVQKEGERRTSPRVDRK